MPRITPNDDDSSLLSSVSSFLKKNQKIFIVIGVSIVVATFYSLSSTAQDVAGGHEFQHTKSCEEYCESVYGGGSKGSLGGVEASNNALEDEDPQEALAKATAKMLEKAKKAREGVIQSTTKLYGEKFFGPIFGSDDDGRIKRAREIFKSPSAKKGETSESHKRLIRTLMIKLLNVQVAEDEQKERRLQEDACNCEKLGLSSHKLIRHRRLEEKEEEDGFVVEYASSFIWATGGHSSAAGHGNLYNETYSVFLQRTASHMFSKLGIAFESRNRAMGGMSSAPEIAFCFDQIFGSDVDGIGWDYGMVDGRHYDLAKHYGNRAALSNKRMPAMFMFGTDTDEQDEEDLGGRGAVMKEFEDNGMAALSFNDNLFRDAIKAIPDMSKVTPTDLPDIPEYLRFFKCQNKIERGEPGCKDKKYTNDQFCPNRNYMADWHPGWKHHALKGSFTGLFFVEMLYDAITTLDSIAKGDIEVPDVDTLSRTKLLQALDRQEAKDRSSFMSSNPPAVELEVEGIDDIAALYHRSHSICHTALLGADAFDLGVTGKEHMDSITLKKYKDNVKLNEKENSPSPIQMIQDEDSRQECEFELNQDHKDYWYISDAAGWTSVTAPTDSEMSVYADPKTENQGAVVICQTTCDWGDCPDWDLDLADVEKNDFTLLVDGQPVTKAVQLTKDRRCFFILGENGGLWGPGNAGKGKGGQYEFKVHVNKPDRALRISSIIVF